MLECNKSKSSFARISFLGVMIMNKEKGKEGRKEGRREREGGKRQAAPPSYKCATGRPETCAIIRFHIVGNVRNY